MSTPHAPPPPSTPADEPAAPPDEPTAPADVWTAPADETAPPDGRVRLPWTRVLVLGVLAFALWFLVFAPTLQHNAQVSPVGQRRTVSLDITGPVATLSRDLQLSRIVSGTGRSSRQPGGTIGLITSGPRPHPHTPKTKPNQAAPPGAPTTTTPPPPDPKHPTAAAPLRVLIVGDSIGLDMGGALQSDLAATGVVTAALDARESTGLTRPDYFDWPAELTTDLKAADPQVVVVMIGANDAQDFLGPPDTPYASPKWNDLYTQRVAQFLQIASSGGATVVWVGMPPMQNPALSAQLADLNVVDQQQAAAAKPPATFVSTQKSLGSATGAYTAFVTNAAGQIVNTRTPDGIHLTPGGSQVVAQQVIAQLVTNGYHIP
jgi:lysophospholipase L1-like esterase